MDVCPRCLLTSRKHLRRYYGFFGSKIWKYINFYITLHTEILYKQIF